jgi:hypothetical protein
VRQVFIVEFEFQRVSSRPGVYDARATPSVDLFSLSRSRRVVFASRRLRARPLTLSHRVHRDARAQRLRRARPVRRVVSLPPFRARCFPVHRVVLSRASRVVRPFARSRRSFVRALVRSRAHSCIRASFARSRRSRTAATAFGSFIALALVPDVPLVARFPIVISFQS